MSNEEESVLIFAPTGRDGPLLQDAIRRSGRDAEYCQDASGFMQGIARANGAVLLAEEALTPELITALGQILNTQPTWSDLPILLLTSGGRNPSPASESLVKVAGDRGNITLLERPLRTDTLMSLVNSALRSRRRQYQIRDHLLESQANEEKYREAAKLEGIGILAGGIAHDFNNLLTGILGNASLALEMESGNKALAERLAEVVQAGERAAELTSQLLAYAGKGRFIVKPVNISVLAAEITPLVRRFIPAHADLQLRLQENLPFTEGDTGQLQQVVMNLVINAGEAIPEDRPGTITVSTGVRDLTAQTETSFVAANPEPGRYVYLNVQDDGCGMPEDVRVRIFDPFFTTKFLGRGLGLAAVLGIVRSHKGALSVSSRAGAGTTFSVFFPVSGDSAPQTPVAPSRQEEAPVSATVLFVDDDTAIRSVASHSLTRSGMRVHLAVSGAEAIEILGRMKDEISLVILDLTMPGMNGEQCYAALRAISPDVPVVLSSGFSESMLKDRFKGSGLAGYLQKPYTSKQLVERIAAVLSVVTPV